MNQCYILESRKFCFDCPIGTSQGLSHLSQQCCWGQNILVVQQPSTARWIESTWGQTSLWAWSPLGLNLSRSVVSKPPTNRARQWTPASLLSWNRNWDFFKSTIIIDDMVNNGMDHLGDTRFFPTTLLTATRCNTHCENAHMVQSIIVRHIEQLKMCSSVLNLYVLFF